MNWPAPTPGPNMRLENYMGKPPSTAFVQEKINITQCDLGRVVRGARLKSSNLALWQDIAIIRLFPGTPSSGHCAALDLPCPTVVVKNQPQGAMEAQTHES